MVIAGRMMYLRCSRSGRHATEPMLYVWAADDQLRGYRLANGKFEIKPNTTAPAKAGYPGGMLAVSADGSKAGSGIVWAVTSEGRGLGTLHAFDAVDLTRELWNSHQNAERDSFTRVSNFTPPLVVNGKVYLATCAKEMVVYGLLQ